MNERPCPRCHAVPTISEDATLVFCWNCGAPQVVLTEELRTQAEGMRAESQELGAAARTAGLTAANRAAVNWKIAIRCTALVAALFSPACLLLPPLTMVVPPLAIALYGSRQRDTRFSAGVGMRFGLLCGLFAGLTVSVLETAAMLLLRFGGQQTDDFDRSLALTLDRVHTQMVAQSGQAAADLMAGLLSIPESRAGFLLSGLALFLVLLLVLSSAGGALAGWLRARSQLRST